MVNHTKYLPPGISLTSSLLIFIPRFLKTISWSFRDVSIMLIKPFRLLFILLLSLSVNAQKKPPVFQCLEGQCKTGEGIAQIYISDRGYAYPGIISHENDIIYYQGEFKKGLPHGKGRLIRLPFLWYDYDRKIQGNIYNTLSVEKFKTTPAAVLVHQYRARFLYEGEFIDGRPAGKGSLHIPGSNNHMEYTKFKNDQMRRDVYKWHLELGDLVRQEYSLSIKNYTNDADRGLESFYGIFSSLATWDGSSSGTVRYYKGDALYYSIFPASLSLNKMDSVINRHDSLFARLTTLHEDSLLDQPEKGLHKPYNKFLRPFFYEQIDFAVNRPIRTTKPGVTNNVVRYYIHGFENHGWVIEGNSLKGKPQELRRNLYFKDNLVDTSRLPFPADEARYNKVMLGDTTYYGSVNEKNQPDGYGELTYTDQQALVYFEGYFQDGQQVGPGRTISYVGSTSPLTRAGYFHDYKMQWGYEQLGGGGYFAGRYCNIPDCLNDGQLTDNSGRIYYQGQMSGTNPHGQGTKYFPNGVRQQGTWRFGVLTEGVITGSLGKLNINDVVKYNGVSSYVVQKTTDGVLLANGTRIRYADVEGKDLLLGDQYAINKFKCECPGCKGSGRITRKINVGNTTTTTNYYKPTHMMGLYNYVGSKTVIEFSGGFSINATGTCGLCNGGGRQFCRTEVK